MLSWLMAKYYDAMLRDAEEKCLHDWRKGLLTDVQGDIIELGCGTGANLAFYPATVNHLVLAEPSAPMRQQLNLKLAAYPHLPVFMVDYSAESIPVADESFDAVVSTLLLCTVKDPKLALTEIHRILKPQGKLLFIEHVAATHQTNRLKWQRRIEPFWKILQCGCHLTRDTEKNILQAGFKFEKINRQSMRGVPGIVRPSIYGEARKI
ncbi:MAG TPA: class I SAM-dependent methyltransferase [Gammaproteobacteria bacterium]|nr:class I SAM-dependent methyltransferase [Gammaproteobacteria bacterium]